MIVAVWQSDVFIAILVAALGIAVVALLPSTLLRRSRSQIRAWLVLLVALSGMLGLLRIAYDRQLREEHAAAQLVQHGLGVAWSEARPRWFWHPISAICGQPFRHVLLVSPELKANWAHSDETQQLDAEVLAVLADLPWVRRVELSLASYNAGPFVTPRISDAEVAYFAGLRRLEELDLSGQPLTDACLPYLELAGSLAWVDLSDTEVTAAGVARLRNALPRADVREP